MDEPPVAKATGAAEETVEAAAQPVGRVPRKWIVLGLLGALAAVYPIPIQMAHREYFQIVGFLTFLYAMLAIGWNIMVGWAGQFTFGEQIWFGVGAYTTGLLLAWHGVNPWLGMLAAIAMAVVICAPETYILTKLRGHYFAIATIASWMIVYPFAVNWEFIGASRGVPLPMKQVDSWAEQWLNMRFSGAIGWYYLMFGLFLVVFLVSFLVYRSKLGYCFRAVRDDQEGAEALGINSRFYKVVARSFTAGIFAIGGSVFAMWALYLLPDGVLALKWIIFPLMVGTVGGVGTLWGPVVGALIFIPASELIRTYVVNVSVGGRSILGIDLIIFGIAVMLIAAFRPAGAVSIPWGQALRWVWNRRRVVAKAPVSLFTVLTSGGAKYP